VRVFYVAGKLIVKMVALFGITWTDSYHFFSSTGGFRVSDDFEEYQAKAEVVVEFEAPFFVIFVDNFVLSRNKDPDW
jgi:hypothetical protein